MKIMQEFYFAFISLNFAQNLRHFAPLCDCLIATVCQVKYIGSGVYYACIHCSAQCWYKYTMHNSCMLCTILMHNYAQQTCTRLSTTYNSFELCRFIVELCICAQFFTLCKTHAQQNVHDCSKSEGTNLCTSAQQHNVVHQVSIVISTIVHDYQEY